MTVGGGGWQTLFGPNHSRPIILMIKTHAAELTVSTQTLAGQAAGVALFQRGEDLSGPGFDVHCVDATANEIGDIESPVVGRERHAVWVLDAFDEQFLPLAADPPDLSRQACFRLPPVHPQRAHEDAAFGV